MLLALDIALCTPDVFKRLHVFTFWGRDLMEISRILFKLGLPESMADILRSYGYNNLNSLLTLSSRELAAMLKIDVRIAERILEEVRKAFSFNAKDIISFIKISKHRRFTTGSSSLDLLFGGGIPLGLIIEIAGESGTGKTQLCHQLCVTVQMDEEHGGLGGRAVYIDTEGTFRPERIIQIAKYRGLEPKTTLKNILLASAKTFAEEYSLISSIERLDKSYKLLIVDTLTSPLQVEYADDVVTRRWALGRLLMKLREIADREMAVIVANRVISDPNTGEVKPLGGTLMAQGVDYRIMLYKGRKKDERIARLIYGVDVPEGEARFRIVEYGIDDV